MDFPKFSRAYRPGIFFQSGDIAVVFFNKTQMYIFFPENSKSILKSASNALKIGVDPFLYAPSRLRVSAWPETISILI